MTVSIYNELYHPTNGGNYIAVYLSPNLRLGQLPRYPQGDLESASAGRRGSRRAIQRVDRARRARWRCDRVGRRRMFRFPSFFTEKSNVDSHSITTLACGHRVIAVANLDDRERRRSTSPAARARHATADSSRRSPRLAQK